MIDKQPTPGSWVDTVMEPYDDRSISVDPLTHDEIPHRVSSVLGPDGEYLRVPVPRRRIGFDLFGGK